jgi:hypothetical protein
MLKYNFGPPSKVQEYCTKTELFGHKEEVVVEYEMDGDGDIYFVSVRLAHVNLNGGTLYQPIELRFIRPSTRLDWRREIRMYNERLLAEMQAERHAAA